MNRNTLAAAVALGASVFWAASAQANLIVAANIDGAGFVTIGTGGNDGPVVIGFPSAATFGPFTLTAMASSSNSPGVTGFAELLSSTLSIVNNTGATHHAIISVSTLDFTTPTTPPNVLLESSAGGTVSRSGDFASNLMAFSSCVFSDNLNHNLCAGATATAGPSTAPINVQGIFDDLKLATITSLGAPYSVLQEWDVTMGGHSSINFGSDTNLINVPEPASLAIFGSALLGFGLIRRRRRNG